MIPDGVAAIKYQATNGSKQVAVFTVRHGDFIASTNRLLPLAETV